MPKLLLTPLVSRCEFFIIAIPLSSLSRGVGKLSVYHPSSTYLCDISTDLS